MSELVLKTFDTAELLAKEGLNQVAFRTYLTALTASAKHLSQLELSSVASISSSENSRLLQIFEISSLSLLKAHKLYIGTYGSPSIPPKAPNRPFSQPRPYTLDPDSSSLDSGPLLLLTPPSTTPTNLSFQECDGDVFINVSTPRARDSCPQGTTSNVFYSQLLDLLSKLDTVFSKPFVKKPPGTGGRARARSLVNSFKARFDFSLDETVTEPGTNHTGTALSSPPSSLKTMFSSPTLGALERYSSEPLTVTPKLSTPSLSEEETFSEKASLTNTTTLVGGFTINFGVEAEELVSARTLPSPDAPTSTSNIPRIPRSPLLVTLSQANLRLDTAKKEIKQLSKEETTETSFTLKRLQQVIWEASATLEEISRLTRIDTIEYTFTFFPPKLVAYQVTLIESAIFHNIPSSALKLHTPRQPQTSIVASTSFFNFLTRAIELSILDSSEVEERVETISFWIQVGETLETLHNFQTLQAVVSGLNTPPLTRLKRTWSRLPKKRLSRLQSIQKLMSETDNYQLYRKNLGLLDNSNLSMIPYLGVFIMDMTYLSAIQSKTSKEEDKRVTQLLSQFENYLARSPHPISPPPRFLKGHGHIKSSSASFPRSCPASSPVSSPPMSPSMSFVPFMASLLDSNGEADGSILRRKPLQDRDMVRQMQLVLSHFILNRPWIPDNAVDRRSLVIEPRPTETISEHVSHPETSWFSTSKSQSQSQSFFKYSSSHQSKHSPLSSQPTHILDVDVPPHQLSFELESFQKCTGNFNNDSCPSPILTNSRYPPTNVISSNLLSVPLSSIDD